MREKKKAGGEEENMVGREERAGEAGGSREGGRAQTILVPVHCQEACRQARHAGMAKGKNGEVRAEEMRERQDSDPIEPCSVCE